MKLSALAVALSFVVVSSAAHAATTWYVDNTPGDAWNPPAGTIYATIQEGIDASANGDTVRVYPGTYTSTGAEVVNLRGKAITLEAALIYDTTNRATWAEIDGEDVRRCIEATANEGSSTIVRGMRIYRGRASAGGGMYVVDGSPRIEDCWFVSNVATTGAASGGALRLLNSTSVIDGCYFQSNSADAEGGAIFNAGGAIMASSRGRMRRRLLVASFATTPTSVVAHHPSTDSARTCWTRRRRSAVVPSGTCRTTTVVVAVRASASVSSFSAPSRMSE